MIARIRFESKLIRRRDQVRMIVKEIEIGKGNLGGIGDFLELLP